MSRFEKKTKILDRDTSLSVRGYVFEAFFLGNMSFYTPVLLFWKEKCVTIRKNGQNFES